MIEKFDGRWGKAQLPVPADFSVCPVAVPTVTLGAAQSMFITGASVENYMLVAPESIMPVVFFGRACCWNVWLALTLLIFGKVAGVMSRVALNLSV